MIQTNESATFQVVDDGLLDEEAKMKACMKIAGHKDWKAPKEVTFFFPKVDSSRYRDYERLLKVDGAGTNIFNFKCA